MRGIRIGAALSVVALVMTGFSVAAATPAFAAVPTNDTIQGATEITTVPTTITEDTTEATTDALETSLNATCGAPVVDHGVWFHATVAQDGFYTADVTQSSYSAGIMVVAGPADSPTFVNCAPGSITGPLQAGQDIYLLVFGDGGSDGTAPTSGTMVLSITQAPPPPSVDLTVNSRGSFGRDGSATISGTITCSGDGSGGSDVFGIVNQRVGRSLFSSFFDNQPGLVCDGTPQPWSGTATPQNGLFGGGKASVDVTATVCDVTENCGSAEVAATVQLSGGGNGKH
jgi:hypothetical protein